MSFRRIPFRFSSTDPVQRQAELEKRFGLSGPNMYVDVTNPLSADAGNKDPNVTASSPRLQHRVPIFVEGSDHPVKSSVDSSASSDCKKKPNVRVIPIEIEGADSRPSTRHRTFSGPAGWAKGNDKESAPVREESSPIKRSMQDLSEPSKMRVTEGPVVHNIPIKIENRPEPQKPLKSDKTKLDSSRKDKDKLNGCVSSKQPNKIKTPEEEHKTEESPIEIPKKKIHDVLEELKLYDSEVQKFTGTVKDKQYRYLDEMLTRCMLRLDSIDTMGNEEVRSTRKNAVKKVQASIDLLETKVNSTNHAAIDKKDEELENTDKEVISTDMKEMNDGDVEMKDLTPNNVEDENHEDTASEVQMTESKVAEGEVQSSVSEAETHVPSNVRNKRTEVELPEGKDLNKVEMMQAKSDACETNVIPSNEMDKKMPNTCKVAEIEMTEAENFSQNICSEKSNKVCDVEMAESRPEEFLLSQNSTISSGTVEIKDALNDAGSGSKIIDVEMEDIQCIPAENVEDMPAFAKSNAEVASDQQPDTSNVSQDNQKISGCGERTNNVIDASESHLDTPQKTLIGEADEMGVDSTFKDTDEKATDVSSTNENSSSDNLL